MFIIEKINLYGAKVITQHCFVLIIFLEALCGWHSGSVVLEIKSSLVLAQMKTLFFFPMCKSDYTSSSLLLSTPGSTPHD